MIDGYYRYLTLDREFRYQCYVESEVYKIIL